MKALFFFLLFPFVLLSQDIKLLDTVFNSNNIPTSCFVTKTDGIFLYLNTKNAQETKVALSTLNKVDIDGKGVIWNKNDGLEKIVGIENLNRYLAKRSRLYDVATPKGVVVTEDKDESGKNEIENKYSFGFLMMPASLYSSIKPLDSRYTSYYYSLLYPLPAYESQFAFNVEENFSITLNIGYNYFQEEIKGSDDSFEYSVNTYLLEVGGRLYLSKLESKKVRPYFSATVGKVFALADISMSSSDYDFENSIDELEDANSRWMFTVGFGAEYYFNTSISVSTNLKLYYSNITIHESGYDSSTEKNLSRFENHVGVGLHLHF